MARRGPRGRGFDRRTGRLGRQRCVDQQAASPCAMILSSSLVRRLRTRSKGCIKIARTLKKGDAAAVAALLVKAAAIGLSSIEAEMLLKAIAEAIGVTLKPLRTAWAK